MTTSKKESVESTPEIGEGRTNRWLAQIAPKRLQYRERSYSS
jgi:hypothetical protein